MKQTVMIIGVVSVIGLCAWIKRRNEKKKERETLKALFRVGGYELTDKEADWLLNN